jgi:hypothetical protein
VTDADKIVAAIFAASMCGKVNATAAEYLQAYYEMLKKIEEHEKPLPVKVTPDLLASVKRSSRRKRP